MSDITVFLTGGSGFIGRWTVVELTRLRRKVGLLMRTNNAQVREEYLNWINRHGGNAELIQIVEGDLAKPGLGLSAENKATILTAQDFYHLGALMDFGLTQEKARLVNVAGTQQMLDLARQAKNLRRFVLLSGYMVSDERCFAKFGINLGGLVANDSSLVETANFSKVYKKVGAYEASKMEADWLVRSFARQTGLPVTIVNPAGVIGDSRNGEATQFFGFGALVESLLAGRLTAIPATDHDRLELISVDYLASFLARVTEIPATVGQAYWLLDKNVPNFPKLIEHLARYMGLKPPRARISRSLLAFLLKIGFSRILHMSHEALSFINSLEFDTTSTDEIASQMGLVKPGIYQTIDKCVDYMRDTDFGKNLQNAPLLTGSLAQN